MGTDIHMYVEKQNDDGSWSLVREVPAWKCSWCAGTGKNHLSPCYSCKGTGHTVSAYHDRNYDLFAMLANVRNGRGFAGCDTGDGFEPLAMPRGLPENLSKELAQKYNEDDENAPWLGDHSFSFASLTDVLMYNYDRTTAHRGVVDSAVYAEWVKNGRNGAPTDWSGGVSGKSVQAVSNERMDQLIEQGIASTALPSRRYDLTESRNGIRYVTTIQWTESYRNSAAEAWFNFLDACKKLGDPDRIRLVFGFDS